MSLEIFYFSSRFISETISLRAGLSLYSKILKYLPEVGRAGLSFCSKKEPPLSSSIKGQLEPCVPKLHALSDI